MCKFCNLVGALGFRTKPHSEMLDGVTSEKEIPGTRVITVPRVGGLTDNPRDSREPADLRLIHLEERRIFSVAKRSIVLGIGGPPNSGKSTFAASLVGAVGPILTSLVSRGGPWRELENYFVQLESLDAGTPTVDAILAGQGGNQRELRERKVSWTKELARQTARQVRFRADEDPSLTLSDFPGKIDDVTGILAEAVDVACIITRDWDQVEEWRDFFDQRGIPVVGEFASSLASSMPTSFDRGMIFRGRIHMSDRQLISWDGVVRAFAEALLFDLLPTCVQRNSIGEEADHIDLP